MLNKSSDKENSQDTMKQILDSITNKDKDVLRSVFSSQALEEVSDLDSDMEYLFQLFKGDVINCEISTGPQVSESNDHGKITKELKTWYEVETDESEYVFFVLEYTENTAQPNKLGVYSLRVVSKDEESNHMTYWQDMVMPGIYRADKCDV